MEFFRGMSFMNDFALALLLCTPALLMGAGRADDEPLRVPAFTAYCEPDPNGVKISAKEGVTGWTDTKQSLSWFGHLEKSGKLYVALSVSLPKDAQAKWKLEITSISRLPKNIRAQWELDTTVKSLEAGLTSK